VRGGVEAGVTSVALLADQLFAAVPGGIGAYVDMDENKRIYISRNDSL
jgi:hypothetical protein